MTCPLRYATKRETLPNISSYPVAHEVIFQAVKNTWERVIQVMECEMEIAELEEANMNLALWLMDTFTGQNEHFSCCLCNFHGIQSSSGSLRKRDDWR